MAHILENGRPKVHRHKDSGLSYLRGADKVLFENGAYLSRQTFDRLKSTPGALKKRLDEAAQSEPQSCGYDWAYACTTGNLRRKRARENLVASEKAESRRRREAAYAMPVEAEAAQKSASRRRVFSSVFLVTAVMTIVGVGSAVMSAYHTATFLYEGGKPAWTALLTGTMLILFSGTAFTAARYFFQEKGALCVFGWFFVVTGLLVIVYSMFSTLTVNYDQFQRKAGAKASVAVAEDEALASHTRRLDMNRAALEEAAAGITRLEGETEYWKDKSWRRYDALNAELAGAKRSRDALRSELARLETLTPALAEEAAPSRETIYTFLARLLGLPEDVARFFVHIVPACLYDILAPFALSVVLLLLDRRKKHVDGHG